MTPLLRRALVFPLLLAPLLVVGCSPGEPKTIKSTDGTSSVVVPGDWKVMAELHDEAELEVGQPVKETYAIVLTERKAELELLDIATIEKHSEITRTDLVSGLVGAKVEGPKELEINGMKAIQYEITAKLEGLDVVWLHTTIDGKEHIHQLLAWTLADRLSRNRPVLDGVITSFEEVE